MANKTQMEYTINVRAKTDQAINDIKALGNSLNTAFAGGAGNKELANSLGKLDKLVNNLTDKLNKPVTSESTFNKIKDDTNDAVLELNKLLSILDETAKATNEDKINFVDSAALARLQSLRDLLVKYNQSLNEAQEKTKAISNLEKQKAATEAKLQKATENQKAANDQVKKAIKLKADFIEKVKKQKEIEDKINNGARGQIELEAASLRKENQSTADTYQYGSIESAYNAKLSRATTWANEEVDKANIQVKKLTDELNKTDIAFKQAQTDLTNLNSSISQETWQQLAKAFREVGISLDDIDPNDIGTLSRLVEQKDIQILNEANQKIQQQANLFKTLIPLLNEAKQENEENAQAYRESNNELGRIDNIKNRIKQIVSLTGAMHLLTRATRSAFQTIKELDKTMTETAVVTDFSVGDMWDQLDSYAEKANQLGMAINDVYEASTLYYQQGLSTQQVTALTTQTLKMARIAGLDAAEATDRMTAALRGFNMTINETNATNVSDVYSKLAAITASNVDEISTAMTKVASLANSANMSFENTAAFLSQIIETTRESAETAGTALKTVVARFAEVKTNINTTTDSEGEELNYNKIDAALKSVGISMDAFMKGQEGLDQVLMRLAEKWDTLDTVTQRYIATQAAGSRQQSRFIALMSDYQRTLELTTAAQNAAGASATQYDKTLESMQTKLNNLKNAWDTLAMSLMNSELLKGIVDLLTNIVNGVNKLNSSLTGTGKSIAVVAELVVTLGLLDVGLKLIERSVLKTASSFAVGTSTATAFDAALNKLNGTGIITSSVFGKLYGVIIKLLGELSTLIFNCLVPLEAALGSTVAAVAAFCAIILAVVAAIVAVVKAVKTFQNLSAEGRVKTLTKELSNLNDELDNTNSLISEINTSLDNINSAIDTLNGLTKGTSAWNTQLLNVNQQIADFMTQYPEFADMVEQTSDGMYFISDENQTKIKQILEDRARKTKGKIAITTVEKNKANIQANADNIAKEIATNAGAREQNKKVSQVISNLLSDKNIDTQTLLNGEGLNQYLKGTGIENLPEKELIVNQIYQKIPEIIDLLKQNNNIQSANTVLLNTYAQSLVTEENGQYTGYISKKIQQAAQNDNTDYFAQAGYTQYLSGQEQKFLNDYLGEGYTYKSHKNGQITYTDTNGVEHTEAVTDLKNKYNTDRAYTAAADNQNIFAINAQNYSTQFKKVFGDTITESMLSGLTAQMADIEAGITNALDLSGINYKDILAADSNIFEGVAQEAFKNAQINYRNAYMKAAEMANNLGLDANSQDLDDLVTKLVANQGGFESGINLSQTLAKFTVAELQAMLDTSFGKKYEEEIQNAINNTLQETKTKNQNVLKEGADQYINANLDTRFAQANVSATDEENIINSIKSVNEELAQNETLLKAVALQAVETTAGLTAIDEVYQENSETIALANKSSAEYWKSLGNLANAWNSNFGTKINSTFMGMDDNLQLFQKAMKGDIDALIEFQKRANAFDVSNLNINFGLGDEDKLKELIAADNTGWLAKAGEDMSNTLLVSFVTNLINDGKIAIEDAMSLLAKSGYQLTGNNGNYGAIAMGSTGIKTGLDNQQALQGMDYLKGQYRTLTQITSLQQKLTKAEATYNKLVAAGNKSLRTRSKYLKEQMDANASLANAYSVLAEQRADALEKYLAEAGNSIYFEFDADTGNLTQLVEEIPEQIAKDVEELYKNYADAINSADEYTTANYEIKKQGKADYYSLIEETAAMLQEQDQKKVELLQQQLDAEKEASKKLIESIQSNFTQLRQDRENEEKENDINTLARRIAYLRQDTSGSNALQIRQLEKELASKTQDYGDNLIDQSINQLSEQQDAAYDQRQQQIDNQSSMIEWMANYGTYNQQATEVIDESLRQVKDGVALANTEFGKIVTNTGKALTESQLSQKIATYGEEFVNALNRDYIPTIEENVTTPITDSTKSIADKLGSALGYNPIPVTVSNKEPEKDPEEDPEWVDPNTGFPGGEMTEEVDHSTALGPSTVNKSTAQKVASAASKSSTVSTLVAAASTKLSSAKSTISKVTTAVKTAVNTATTAVKNTVTKATTAVSNAVSKAKTIVSGVKSLFSSKKYASGGLNTSTGPAWLDGTPSKPELVLNAQDTKNFLELKDVLKEWKGSNITNNGNYAFDVNINVDQLSNDYDVDDLAERVEKNITDAMKYRNNTRTNRTR